MKDGLRFAAFLFAFVLLTSGCSSTRYAGVEQPSELPPPADNMDLPRGKSYVIENKRYYPYTSAQGFVQTGLASWYGPRFHGKLTANGERFNTNAMTAAHKELPFNTKVRVTNLENGRTIVVRINDRGPFISNRIIDLSKQGAKSLGMLEKGVARVRIEALDETGKGRPAVLPPPPVQQRLSLPAPQPRPVLAPAVPPRSPQIQPKPAATGHYYVQIGAFSSPVNSGKAAATLRDCGYPECIFSSSSLQIVMAGPFASAGEAAQAARQLKSRFPDAFTTRR